ncbi:MAG TPA: hypothetical protein VF094_11390 [Gaiellaceae bacterium]
MPDGPDRLRGAVAARDAALTRVRRATAVVAAGCVALGGTFAALAAASTHPRHHLTGASVRTTRGARTRIVAPAPPLVAVSQASAPASQPSAPPPTAAPPAAPPVAVSGGS